VELVKAELGAPKALVFDWRVRSSVPSTESADGPQSTERSNLLSPATIAHSDYSWAGGVARLKRQLSAEEAIMYDQTQWHIRIINVWRPLVDKVFDAPLAFCDRRYIKQDDLLEEDKIHSTHWEEGLYLQYRPYHKWYYLSKQARDEVAIFMTWDADEGENHQSMCPPHASFRDEAAAERGPPRESVEVRLMVFSKR